MRKILLLVFALGLVTPLLGGCVVAALGVAGGAGYLAADETKEHDGNFDPLENVRGKDDGRN